MSKPTYFVQACPTCGRSLHIRVEYLGRHVVCQHCHGKFEALDMTGVPEEEDSGLALLRRADALLEMAERRRVHTA